MKVGIAFGAFLCSRSSSGDPSRLRMAFTASKRFFVSSFRSHSCTFDVTRSTNWPYFCSSVSVSQIPAPVKVLMNLAKKADGSSSDSIAKDRTLESRSCMFRSACRSCEDSLFQSTHVSLFAMLQYLLHFIFHACQSQRYFSFFIHSTIKHILYFLDPNREITSRLELRNVCKCLSSVLLFLSVIFTLVEPRVL